MSVLAMDTPTRAALQARNARRLQWLVTLALIAVLASALLARMTELSAANEEIATRQTVVLINTLVTQLVVEHAVRGKLNDLGAYADTNPMRLLQRYSGSVPMRYVGEISGARGTALPPGSWAFDTDSRELVYRYVNRNARVRLRLLLAHQDSDSNDAFDPGTDRVTGLYLRRAISGEHVY